LVWIGFYNLFIIVILPSILSAVFNTLTYVKVRSSTRRVHAAATTMHAATHSKQQNARDVYLLKHMLFIFVIFIIGWAPIYIFAVIDTNIYLPYWVYSLLQTFPVFSLLIDIVDLFLYNHDLRQYLKERCLNRP
jgi:hypothetical protein